MFLLYLKTNTVSAQLDLSSGNKELDQLFSKVMRELLVLVSINRNFSKYWSHSGFAQHWTAYISPRECMIH